METAVLSAAPGYAKAGTDSTSRSTWLRTKMAETAAARTMNPTATRMATCMACTNGLAIEAYTARATDGGVPGGRWLAKAWKEPPPVAAAEPNLATMADA